MDEQPTLMPDKPPLTAFERALAIGASWPGEATPEEVASIQLLIDQDQDAALDVLAHRVMSDARPPRGFPPPDLGYGTGGVPRGTRLDEGGDLVRRGTTAPPFNGFMDRMPNLCRTPDGNWAPCPPSSVAGEDEFDPGGTIPDSSFSPAGSPQFLSDLADLASGIVPPGSTQSGTGLPVTDSGSVVTTVDEYQAGEIGSSPESNWPTPTKLAGPGSPEFLSDLPPGSYYDRLTGEIRTMLTDLDRDINVLFGGDDETISARVGRRDNGLVSDTIADALDYVDPGHTLRAVAGSQVNRLPCVPASYARAIAKRFKGCR